MKTDCGHCEPQYGSQCEHHYLKKPVPKDSWFKVIGDLDDFIFYGEDEFQISER